jgi:hypothetical protein
MAFTGRTPESLIPRSDSRNPATTCKGITKSGRPCRRPIDAKASQDDGVLAVVSVISDEDDEEIGAAAYFCWQHKDQAEQLAAQASSGTHLYPLKERNSIDTLVERLGVLEVDEPTKEPRRKRRGSRVDNETSAPRPPRRINRPATWDKVEGPLISIPSDVMAAEKRRTRPPKPAPQQQKPSFWASLCLQTTIMSKSFGTRSGLVMLLSPRSTSQRRQCSRYSRRHLEFVRGSRDARVLQSHDHHPQDK